MENWYILESLLIFIDLLTLSFVLSILDAFEFLVALEMILYASSYVAFHFNYM